MEINPGDTFYKKKEARRSISRYKVTEVRETFVCVVAYNFYYKRWSKHIRAMRIGNLLANYDKENGNG